MRLLLLPVADMPSLAAAGVEQLLRLTMFLQPSMEGLLPSAAAGSTAAANNGVSVSNARSSTQASAARFTDVQERVAGQFDAARLYYSLLTAAPAEVQRTLATRPYAFTHGEWLTLLQVS